MPQVHDWNEEATLKVHAYSSLAGNVQIYLGGHHRTNWDRRLPFPAFVEEAAHIKNYGDTRSDVVIGSHVWNRSNSIIFFGVTIGHGAVIANSSVVTRDVAPYAVVAGNPAQQVSWRFAEEQRQALLETSWWDWPEAEVRAVAPLLCSADITAFLDHAHRRSVQ